MTNPHLTFVVCELYTINTFISYLATCQVKQQSIAKKYRFLLYLAYLIHFTIAILSKLINLNDLEGIGLVKIEGP